MNAVIQAQIHHNTLFHTSRNHQHHQALELRAWMGRTRMTTLTLWLVILLISFCVPSSEGVQTERIIRKTISCSNVTLASALIQLLIKRSFKQSHAGRHSQEEKHKQIEIGLLQEITCPCSARQRL